MYIPLTEYMPREGGKRVERSKKRDVAEWVSSLIVDSDAEGSNDAIGIMRMLERLEDSMEIRNTTVRYRTFMKHKSSH